MLPLVAPAAAHAGWSWKDPTPQPEQIWASAMRDADHGVLVGAAGTVLLTSDGGVTWTPGFSGLPTSAAITSVTYLDDDTLVAAGDYAINVPELGGFVIRSTNGGATWDTTLYNSLQFILSSTFRDDRNGIAVGFDLATGHAMTWTTDDAGVTWAPHSLDEFGQFGAVRYLDDQTLVAVGLSSDADRNPGPSIAARSTNGGVDWTVQTLASDQSLFGLAFIDAKHGVAVGYGGTIFSTPDAGQTWTAEDSGTTDDLYWVTTRRTQGYVVVGIHDSAGAASGTLLASADGTSWASTSFARGLLGVSFEDDQNGILTGIGGDLYSTIDGGGTWNPHSQHVLDGVVDPSSQVLISIGFASRDVGFAVGGSGAIVRTDDGGNTWGPQTSPTDLTLLGLAVIDADHAIAVGGNANTFASVMLATDSGGAEWRDITPPEEVVPLSSISCPTSTTCTAVGICGLIIHTIDAGTSWTVQQDADCDANASLLGVDFVDDQIGTTVGAATILHTIDGGQTWEPQTVPLDVPGEALGLTAVAFTDAQHGFVTGSVEQSGNILRTIDGGQTWLRDHRDLHPGLDGISFSDSTHGIAVGSDDIYKTVDAGITWTVEQTTQAWFFGVVAIDNETTRAVGFEDLTAVVRGHDADPVVDAIFANGFDS